MTHGHVTGKKRERKGAADWYQDIERKHLERIEREWEERLAVALVLRQIPRQEWDEGEG